MIYRDMISNQDLLRYLSEEHDLFVYYLEVCHTDAIEGFLSEYNNEFMEWVHSELGDDAFDR